MVKFQRHLSSGSQIHQARQPGAKRLERQDMLKAGLQLQVPNLAVAVKGTADPRGSHALKHLLPLYHEQIANSPSLLMTV